MEEQEVRHPRRHIPESMRRAITTRSPLLGLIERALLNHIAAIVTVRQPEHQPVACIGYGHRLS